MHVWHDSITPKQTAFRHGRLNQATALTEKRQNRRGREGKGKRITTREQRRVGFFRERAETEPKETSNRVGRHIDERERLSIRSRQEMDSRWPVCTTIHTPGQSCHLFLENKEAGCKMGAPWTKSPGIQMAAVPSI